MSKTFGKIIIEPTGREALPEENFVARVHLGEGPDKLRFGYGRTKAEAREALTARLAKEGKVLNNE